MPDDDTPIPATPAADADAATDTAIAAAPAADDAAPAAAAAPAEAAAPGAPAVPDMPPAAVANKLAELFPALFAPGQPKPLKLRIQADIQQRAPGLFTKKSLSVFLHRFTTGTPYLVALTKSPTRFDLDGQPAGELAAEHREAAATELARRRGLHEVRRKAENAVRRQAEAQARQEQRAEQAQQEAQQRQQAAADAEGRRERATLLRAFETTTLTRANFLALKGIAEADLEAQLAQARQERAERPPRHDAGDGRRPDHRGEPRRDHRDPRGEPQRPQQRRDGPRRPPQEQRGNRPPRAPARPGPR